MMRISIHAGHSSKVPGASYGRFQEYKMNREVTNALISKLRALGHTVYDDTDDDGSTQNDNLKNIVTKCNSHTVDLVISVHVNYSNPPGNGIEVYYYDQEALASKVSARLAADIGWFDRGAKQDKGKAVLAHTTAPAILLELGFINNESDMAKWNVDRIANSVIVAVTDFMAQTGQNAGGSTGGGTTLYNYVRTCGFDGTALGEMQQFLATNQLYFKPFKEQTDYSVCFVIGRFGDNPTGQENLKKLKDFMTQKGYSYKIYKAE